MRQLLYKGKVCLFLQLHLQSWVVGEGFRIFRLCFLKMVSILSMQP